MLAALPSPTDCTPDDGWSWFSDWSTPGCSPNSDGAVSEVIKFAFGDEYVQDVKNGVSDVVKTMVTFWLSVPDPNVGATDGTSQAEVITFLQSKFVWLAAVLMCFTVAFQCAKMAWVSNGAEPFREIMKMIGNYLATMALAVPAVAIGLMVASSISKWILDEATIGTNFGDNLFGLFNNAAGVTSAIILIVFLVIAAIIAGFQCFIMIARGGMLFVLLPSLAVTSASSSTDEGKEANKLQWSWIKGWIAYKVVAAAIYGVGFKFLGTDIQSAGNGILQIMYGLSLMLMAIFALPATMRLVAPHTSSSNSGSGVGGTIAAAAPIAIGAGLRRAS
jgi:hypothetical protein